MPVQAVVVSTLAVIVFISVSFFFSSAANRTNELEARSYFLEICPVMRCGTPDPYQSAAHLEVQSKKFYDACVTLYPEAKQNPLACIERCQCEIAAPSPAAVRSKIESFIDSIE